MTTSKVQRGHILPVHAGEPVQAVCGECATLVTLTDPKLAAATELLNRDWRYTRESGWCCADCAPLPRLTGTEPNRTPKGNRR